MLQNAGRYGIPVAAAQLQAVQRLIAGEAGDADDDLQDAEGHLPRISAASGIASIRCKADLFAFSRTAAKSNSMPPSGKSACWKKGLFGESPRKVNAAKYS